MEKRREEQGTLVHSICALDARCIPGDTYVEAKSLVGGSAVSTKGLRGKGLVPGVVYGQAMGP